MAFSFGSILKKRFKHKKSKKIETKIDEITENKLRKLKQNISINTQKDYSSEFSGIVRSFFMKFFKVRYQFTYEEFINELKRRRLSNELKSELDEFFKILSNMEFMEKGYEIEELNREIQKFETLIQKVLEEKQFINVEQKQGFFSRLLSKFKITRKFVSPKPKIKPKSEKKVSYGGKPSELPTNLKFKLVNIFTLQIFRKGPKDKLTYLYTLLAEGYEAISKDKIDKAESTLSKIDSIYRTLTPEEARQIKKEIEQLKKEIDSIKQPMKIEKPIERAEPKKEPLLKSIFKKKIVVPQPTHQLGLDLPPPPPPKIEVKPEDSIRGILKTQTQEEIKEPYIKKKPTIAKFEIKEEIPKPFKMEKPELEFYPQQTPKIKQFEKQQIEKQLTEKQPTIEDIYSLELKSIQKGESFFKPKPFFVPSYQPQTSIPKPIEKTKPSEQITKETLPKRLEIVEIVERPKPPTTIKKPITKPTPRITIEDLENMIQTTQHLITKNNFSAAKEAYSKALEIKKSLRLNKDDSERISYDLMGIDIDLKLANLASNKVASHKV